MARNQKSRSRRQRRNKSHSRSTRRHHSQKGGAAILTPATYSNSNNAHFSGIGFTDPTDAVTGCTGGGASNIYTTIGGIKTPVTMKGGRRKSCAKCSRRNCTCKIPCSNCNQLKCACKNKNRMRRRRTQRGGNTNGYSIGGVHLKPSLSGIANNYHTPFDSCKG
jgi:hypothetical protein